MWRRRLRRSPGQGRSLRMSKLLSVVLVRTSRCSTRPSVLERRRDTCNCGDSRGSDGLLFRVAETGGKGGLLLVMVVARVEAERPPAQNDFDIFLAKRQGCRSWGCLLRPFAMATGAVVALAVAARHSWAPKLR